MFRFFRRLKTSDLTTINLSRSGPSISIGPPGLKLTIGPKGIRKTVGIPGSGVFYSTYSQRRDKKDKSFAIGSKLVGAGLLLSAISILLTNKKKG